MNLHEAIERFRLIEMAKAKGEGKSLVGETTIDGRKYQLWRDAGFSSVHWEVRDAKGRMNNRARGARAGKFNIYSIDDAGIKDDSGRPVVWFAVANLKAIKDDPKWHAIKWKKTK
jgi:hypothetical protein